MAAKRLQFWVTMAKAKEGILEVACPDCGAMLKIDAATGLLVSHTSAPRKRMFEDLETAAKPCASRRAQGVDLPPVGGGGEEQGRPARKEVCRGPAQSQGRARRQAAARLRPGLKPCPIKTQLSPQAANALESVTLDSSLRRAFSVVSSGGWFFDRRLHGFSYRLWRCVCSSE